MRESREQMCRTWLSLCEGVSLKARARLLAAFGSFQAAFERFPAGFDGLVSTKTIEELGKLKAVGLDRLLMRLEELGIRRAYLGDAQTYPGMLSHIPDPPDVLFYRGLLTGAEERTVAIVGSRRETRYGRNQACRIAMELAQHGVTVVSGLARGIDTAAHRGALDGKGRTIAVLGSGLSRLYPEENKKLAEEIVAAGGAIVSELPPNTEPLAYHFPMRNRIVSGLAQALLLVEAREKSGTLITVGHALDQGRDVFALPGEVDAPGSLVPHRVIRTGGRLCTCAGDILEDMGWAEHPVPQPEQVQMALPMLPPDQQAICLALQDEDKGFDELLAVTGLDTASINTALTMLELEGLLEPLPGRRFKLRRHA